MAVVHSVALCKLVSYREVDNMGLNRMMMKNSVILKGIEAEMTVGDSSYWVGFMSGYSMGEISPNPLPNGVQVVNVALSSVNTLVMPSEIKSCTINNKIIKHGVANSAVREYLERNIGKTIPIIFHF